MYSYIIGVITQASRNFIVVENNGIGYLIYVANPFDFKLNIEQKVFLYHHVKEDIELLYGFLDEEQKNLFIKLIGVKGIGPKTAIGILAVGSTNEIVVAIEQGNISFLKKLPGIGPKAAQQIILDLQGVLVSKDEKVKVNEALEEAIEVLKALGYKQTEIQKVIPLVSKELLDTNGYVKKALSLMVR